MKRTLAVIAFALLAAGCLIQETTHSLYIDPDGAVTWMVLQKDIYSDVADPQQRRDEEEEFLADAHSGEHAVALALTRLGALWVDSRVLRYERPYMVATEARFARIDDVAQSFMDRLGLRGRAELRWEGESTRLTIICRPGEEEDPELGDDEVLLALLEDAEKYRLVLTEGEFVEAQGFRIEHGGTVAVVEEQSGEEIERNGGAAIYSLTWKVDGEP